MAFNRYMRGMSNGGSIFADATPLDNDQLRAAVPSIFAETAHESRSARFSPIPTIRVLDGLRAEGFEPFFAQQARTRIEGKAEFTKHLLRLRHRGLSNDKGEAFEIILVNANDGTSAYQMLPGFFRFVCANGLFTGDTFNEVKVRHSGDAVSEVIEGAFQVLEDAPRVADQVGTFKGRQLPREAQIAFAEAAHQLRFPAAYEEDEDARRVAPIAPDQLLELRRSEDRTADLWTTFNRVQENGIKGGQRYMHRAPGKRPRRGTVRAVGGIDQNRALNRALWTLTERMEELTRKAAA